MKFALIAHDNKKADMVAFVSKRLPFFNREDVTIITTGTTGKKVKHAGIKDVITVNSGPLGGDAEIAAMVVRKEITGVAAGEKEISFLEQSVPNVNDAPAVYMAKVKLQKQLTQKIIDRNKAFLATGFKQTLDDKGLPTGKYKEFLEANQIKPEAAQVIDYAKELSVLKYDNAQMNFLMNQTFGVGNWEEFFSI